MKGRPGVKPASLALATIRGDEGKGPEIAHGLSVELSREGVHLAVLDDLDGVLAASASQLESSADSGVLGEVRRATEADAVVLLSLAPKWRGVDISVWSTSTNERILSSSAHPRGEFYASPQDVAHDVAKALKALAPPPDSLRDIPVP